MAVSEQFTGISMEQLIGAPLLAVVNAELQLADSTAAFIRQAGVDENGKTRTATFFFQDTAADETGQQGKRNMQVDVPLLAVVPVPNLQIDEVGLTFDMEVKQSERKDSETELGGNMDGGLGFGPAKVAIRGNVSSHNHHTRQSDFSAKYHLDIRATNHGTPEALERVRDMMLAGLSSVPVKKELGENVESAQSLSDAEP